MNKKEKKECKVISLFNQSGGVGKTTLTMNLGYHLAAKKNKVLIIDMDPQASLTIFMGVDPVELEKTIYESIVGDEPLPILSQINQMDLVPSNINLSAAEIELVSTLMRETRLKNAIDPKKDSYDYILIDCPPSLGLLTVISLIASNYILVPIQCQFKSFQGTDLLLTTVAKLKKAANPQLKIAGFIPTMYDSRTAQESRTYKAIAEQLTPLAKVFTPIPKTIAFADASEQRLPLTKIKSNHSAIKIFQQIIKHIEDLQ